MSGNLKYDARTIWFHWLSVGVIAVMWGLAQIIDLFPRPQHVWPRSAHILLGVVLVVLYLARIGWRVTGGRRLPVAETGLIGLAGKLAHYGLYALIAIILGLGLAYEAVRGDSVLNLFQLPSIAPGDKALRDMLGDWHGTAVDVLLVLAGLHAAAALYHHFIRRDGVLRRML